MIIHLFVIMLLINHEKIKINYLFVISIVIALFILDLLIGLLSVPGETLSDFVVFVFYLLMILLEYGLILLVHHFNMGNKCRVYTFQRFLRPALQA